MQQRLEINWSLSIIGEGRRNGKLNPRAEVPDLVQLCVCEFSLVDELTERAIGEINPSGAARELRGTSSDE